MELNFDNSVQDFYAGQVHILKQYALWPEETGWRRLLHFRFHLIFGFGFVLFNLSMVMYVGLNISQMNEVINGFFMLATCAAGSLKLFTLRFHNWTFREYFESFHDGQFRPESLEEQRTFAEARKLSLLIRDFYGGVSLCTLVLLFLAEFMVDNTHLPLAAYDPINGEPGSFSFGLMYAYQCVSLASICFINIAFDSLCCSIFIFVRCQLDILALRLQSIGQTAAQEDVLLQQLKNCIKYYMKVVVLAAKVEALVFKPISVQIFCSVLVLTANFYLMSQIDTLLLLARTLVYQTCMLTQIFIICYYAGEITHSSLGLSHYLYSSNWLGASRRHRRMMLMLMQRLDLPIRIRTLNSSHAFDLVLFSARLCIMSEPQEILYTFYKYQVWYFNLLGVWQVPAEATRLQRVLYHLRGCLFLTIMSLLLLLFIIRVLIDIDQLSVILQVFFMFSTELSCMVKLLNIRLGNRDHAQLIVDMHAHCLRPRSEQELVILRRSAEQSAKCRNFYAFCAFLSGFMMLATVLVVDKHSRPLCMYEPCDVSTTSCYFVLFSYQMSTLISSCLFNVAFDTLSWAFMHFVETQLAMLAARLEGLGASQNDERIALDLRSCCIHYSRIVHLKRSVDRVVKVPGSVQLFCTVLVLIANFYAMSMHSGEWAFLFMLASYQFAMLTQSFLLCYAADQMSHQSAMISHALYSADWTGWSRPNRKLALVMMQCFGEPLHMHTLNHSQHFNCLTYSSIVNCSYSYFALLKRVNS